MNENPVNPLNPVETPSALDSNPPTPSSNFDLRTSNFPAPSALNPVVRNHRGLSRLAGLSARQLEHINTWLDDAVPYRKIAELCRTEFQVDIPHMTIARYYKRSATRQLLDDSTDSQEAAAEISQYAATGDASFSTNTLHLLEQQAFDLALAFHRDGDVEDLDNLKKLSDLIHKAKNTAVRERHAKVQETKCDLRREELALKREALSLRRDTSSPQPSPAPQSDQFGPYARNWDEIGERVRIGHGISKEEWARRLALHKRPCTPATSSSPGNETQTSAISNGGPDTSHSAPKFVTETIAPTNINATPDLVSEGTSSNSNSIIDP